MIVKEGKHKRQTIGEGKEEEDSATKRKKKKNENNKKEKKNVWKLL